MGHKLRSCDLATWQTSGRACMYLCLPQKMSHPEGMARRGIRIWEKKKYVGGVKPTIDILLIHLVYTSVIFQNINKDSITGFPVGSPGSSKCSRGEAVLSDG